MYQELMLSAMALINSYLSSVLLNLYLQVFADTCLPNPCLLNRTESGGDGRSGAGCDRVEGLCEPAARRRRESGCAARHAKAWLPSPEKFHLTRELLRRAKGHKYLRKFDEGRCEERRRRIRRGSHPCVRSVDD